MPSYRAGVQLRLGHDTDAGLSFEKCAELVELVEPGRSIVYLTRKPLTAREQEFFARGRSNLLLKLTATPRSPTLGVTRDPMALVRSAAHLDPRRVHWVVGPLAEDGLEDARAVLDALPAGSRLTLKPVNLAGLPSLAAAQPLGAEPLHDLEARARARGLVVTEFFCSAGLAQVGRGFFDVDRLTGQADQGRRALDLVTCAGCPSRTQCHGPLDEGLLRRRLEAELRVLGLTARGPPERLAPRSLRLAVEEPASRGDETYLAHALGPPVRVTLSTRERGPSEGGSFCNVEPAVLRRWWATGFLPVNELNAAAARVLEDLRRRLGSEVPEILAGLRADAAG
jgi:hypothetical protein